MKKRQPYEIDDFQLFFHGKVSICRWFNVYIENQLKDLNKYWFVQVSFTLVLSFNLKLVSIRRGLFSISIVHKIPEYILFVCMCMCMSPSSRSIYSEKYYIGVHFLFDKLFSLNHESFIIANFCVLSVLW